MWFLFEINQSMLVKVYFIHLQTSLHQRVDCGVSITVLAASLETQTRLLFPAVLGSAQLRKKQNISMLYHIECK